MTMDLIMIGVMGLGIFMSGGPRGKKLTIGSAIIFVATLIFSFTSISIYAISTFITDEFPFKLLIFLYGGTIINLSISRAFDKARIDELEEKVRESRRR